MDMDMSVSDPSGQRSSFLDFNTPKYDFDIVESGNKVEDSVKKNIFQYSSIPEQQNVYGMCLTSQVEDDHVSVKLLPTAAAPRKAVQNLLEGKKQVKTIGMYGGGEGQLDEEKTFFPEDSVLLAFSTAKYGDTRVPENIIEVPSMFELTKESDEVFKFIINFERFSTDFTSEVRQTIKGRDEGEVLEMYYFECSVVDSKHTRVSRTMHFDMLVYPKETKTSCEQQFLVTIPKRFDVKDLHLSFTYLRDYNPKYEDLQQLYIDPSRVSKMLKKIRKMEGYADGFGDIRFPVGYFSLPLADVLPKTQDDLEELIKVVNITKCNELAEGKGSSGKQKFEAHLGIMVGNVPSDSTEESVGDAKGIDNFTGLPDRFLDKFVHHMYIYPAKVNFGKDLVLKIVVRHDDADVTNDNDNLNVFRRMTFEGEAVQTVFTALTTNSSAFYDEIFLELPVENLTSKTHLLFRFYRINPKKKKHLLQLVAYTTVNILQAMNSIVDGKMEMDVVMIQKQKTITNYVERAERTKDMMKSEKMKKRKTFSLELQTRSCVFPRDYDIQVFMTKMEQKELVENFDAKFNYYVSIFPALCDYTISALGRMKGVAKVELMETFSRLVDNYAALAKKRKLVGSDGYPTFLVRYLETRFFNKNASGKISDYPFWIITDGILGMMRKQSEDDGVRLACCRNAWFFYGVIFKSFLLSQDDDLGAQNLNLFYTLLFRIVSQNAQFIIKTIRLIELQPNNQSLNKSREADVTQMNDSMSFLFRKMLSIVEIGNGTSFCERLVYHNYMAIFRDFREKEDKLPRARKYVDTFLLRMCEIFLKDVNSIPLLLVQLENPMGIKIECADLLPQLNMGNLLLDEILCGVFKNQQAVRKESIDYLLMYLANVDRHASLKVEEETRLYSEVFLLSALAFVRNLDKYFSVVNVEIDKMRSKVSELGLDLENVETRIEKDVKVMRDEAEKPRPMEAENVNNPRMSSSLKGLLKKTPKTFKPRSNVRKPVTPPAAGGASSMLKKHINVKTRLVQTKKKLNDSIALLGEVEKDYIFYYVLSVLYKTDTELLLGIVLEEKNLFNQFVQFLLECFELFFYDPRNSKKEQEKMLVNKYKNNCLIMLNHITLSLFEAKDKLPSVMKLGQICECFMKVEKKPFFHFAAIDILEDLFDVYKTQFFQSKDQKVVGFLEKIRARLVLLLLSSEGDIIMRITELFFKMAVIDFSYNGNIDGTIIQTIATITKLENSMTEEVVAIMEGFGENLYNLAENDENAENAKFVECFEVFFEKIQEILGHMLNVRQYRSENNTSKLISYMYKLTLDDTSLGLKSIWLDNLSNVHYGLSNYAESAMCKLVRVAMIYKYFEMEDHWMCRYLPFELLQKCCPYLHFFSEERYEKLLATLQSLSQSSKNELKMNDVGFLSLLEDSIRLFEKCQLFEYCSMLSDLLIRYHRVMKNYPELSKLHTQCARYHTTLASFKTEFKEGETDDKKIVTRYFPRYYYVMLLRGGKFREDQNMGRGVELVFKTPKLTVLGEFMKILKEMYKGEYGEENIVIDSYVKLSKFRNEVLMDRASANKAFFFVQMLDVEKKEKENPWEKHTEFDHNNGLQKLSFEIRIKKTSQLTGNELLDFDVHILTVAIQDKFPFLKLESPVVSNSTEIRSPIQSAVMMLNKSVNNLKAELGKSNPQMSSLTMVIQGSVIPTVQKGIGLVVDTFLGGKIQLKSEEEFKALKDVKRLLGEFLVVSLKCIEKYSKLIASVPQWKLLNQFLNGYETLFKMLTKHLNKDPDFGVDLRQYLMLYHELNAKSKIPPKRK